MTVVQFKGRDKLQEYIAARFDKLSDGVKAEYGSSEAWRQDFFEMCKKEFEANQ